MDIARIISKKIVGTIAPEEQRLLDEWLNNPENRQLFIRLTTPMVFDDYTVLRKRLEQEKGTVWNQLVGYLRPTRPVAIFRPAQIWLKRAAIFLAATTVMVMLYYWSSLSLTGIGITETAEVVPLQPGKARAVLILPNGQTVDLQAREGTIAAGTGTLHNKEGVLEYGATATVGAAAAVLQHQIDVPIGGRYQLSLSDGTRVWLNSTSSLKYPAQFAGNMREVFLEGEAFFDVAPGTHPFIVHTTDRNVSIKVLGTTFNVNAYGDEEHVVTTLLSGKVQLYGKRHPQPLDLKPGQQAVFTPAGQQRAVAQVDAAKYAAWKDGLFLFENETLASIMKRLGRWYAFETVIDSPGVAGRRFTGVAYFDEPLQDILNHINQTTDIHITVKGNTIHLK